MCRFSGGLILKVSSTLEKERIMSFFLFFYLFFSAQRTSQVEEIIYLTLLLGLGLQDDTHITFNTEQNPMWDFKANEGGTTSSYIV